MSEYVRKIDAIRAKQRELLERELLLIEARKKEIIELVEKMGLLTVSDAVLVAALTPILQAIEADNKTTLSALEAQGKEILHGNNRRKSEKSASIPTETTTSYESIDHVTA